jgi:hypothetical protein
MDGISAVLAIVHLSEKQASVVSVLSRQEAQDEYTGSR